MYCYGLCRHVRLSDNTSNHRNNVIASLFILQEVQKHSVHTLVFRSLKRTHDMFIAEQGNPLPPDDSRRVKNVKQQSVKHSHRECWQLSTVVCLSCPAQSQFSEILDSCLYFLESYQLISRLYVPIGLCPRPLIDQNCGGYCST